MPNATSIFLPNASFSKSIAQVLPLRFANLDTLHYFGTSAAESIKNRAKTASPATVVGTVAHGANYSEITDTAGFNLALPINIRSYTAIVVCTDSYLVSDPTTLAMNLSYINSVNAAMFIRRSTTGDEDAFATPGMGSNLSVKNKDVDGNKYRFKAISCDGTNVITATQFQTGLMVKTIALGAVSGIYDVPTLLRLGQIDVNASATAAKMTMAAVYNVALSAAELADAFSGYFRQELAARGMAI